MPFSLYPDGPTSTLLGTTANSPVPLADGAAFAGNQFVPLAPHVGNDPSYFNQPVTFIRISMSVQMPAPTHFPTIDLQAHNPTAGTTGTSVTVPSTPLGGPGVALGDGSAVNAGFDVASAFFVAAPVNNVYFLKIVTEIPNTTFSMRITNNTGDNREFVWVVADTDADSLQPWIKATPSIAFKALVNDAATVTVQSIQIDNRGTGPLTVGAINPGLAAPYVLNPAMVAASGLPATVPPNPAAPVNLLIGFTAAATIGPTPASNFTLNGDAAAVAGSGHNNAFSLSATTAKVEVVMLLDNSGSMGANDTTSGDTRLGELKSAAKQFLNYLAAFGANGGTVGVVRFPGSNPSDITTYDLVLGHTIPAAMTTELTAIDSMSPIDSTPMDSGLQEVFNRTAPVYFATDAASITTNVRWMLLMSDGAWNSGADPHTEIATLQSRHIQVFTAGYGRSGQVDFNTLTDLAHANPGGQTLQVDMGAGFSATALAKQFKSVITNGLTINTAADPEGTILPGQEVSHDVIITPYDRKAVFSLNWDTPSNALNLQLLTPNGERIPLATGAATPGITFSSDPRFRMFAVDGSYLRNDKDPTHPRFGTWRMIVSFPNQIILEARPAAVANLAEHYSYDVLTDSSLRMDISLDRDIYFAGDTIGVTAKVTVNGLPVSGAHAQLSVTKPSQSMDNWLAGVAISTEEYLAAKRKLADTDSSGVYVKAFAAQLKGISFNNPASTDVISMVEAGASGAYAASVNQTSIPDGHTLYVTVTGTTPDGVTFRRDRQVGVYVGVRPDPLFTLFNITYGAQTKRGFASGVVSVTPRDRFGNVILVDPSSSQHILLQAQGATLDPTLGTTFNGSYTSAVTYPLGTTPSFSLIVGGQPVFTSKPVVPVDKFTWVDQVVEFKAGLQAVAGANQHTQPNDALGDVLTKTPTTFVALGGYGSLAVGVNGKNIVAQGDDDVTVFVQANNGTRSYLVEALPAGSSTWVKVGTSPGASASFGLGGAGVTAASAIRITDTSGQTRAADFTPLPDPGAGICAVGIKSVEDASGTGGDGGGKDICIRIQVRDPLGNRLGGTVDIEFQPQDGGETTKVKGVDASADIDVKGLERFPQVSVYEVTVTPTDVFKPTSQFLTIPASGFNTVGFVIDKNH